VVSTSNVISFQYYYGIESEQYSFYRIPKILITDPHFKALSTDAKLLYGLMLDRMSLSYKNGWMDEENRVYIYYTLDEAQEQLCCKTDKAVKLFAELDEGKGIGLIERIRQGQGRPAKIYVKRFVLNTEVKTSEKPKSRPRENRNQDSGKTEVQTSKKPRSRLLEDRSADFGFSERNNTENINTDFNETDLSIHPSSTARWPHSTNVRTWTGLSSSSSKLFAGPVKPSASAGLNSQPLLSRTVSERSASSRLNTS